MVHILFGVSGSGKTTVGKLLSKILQKPFFDADDYHTSENILKMKSMLALTDKDRESWLIGLNKLIVKWNKKGGAILACSALKEKYRSMLAEGNNVSFIFLGARNESIYDLFICFMKYFSFIFERVFIWAFAIQYKKFIV